MADQLLLFAEPLIAGGLLRLLEAQGSALAVVQRPEDLRGAPALVIWRPAAGTALASLRRELTLLRERWQPAPLLLLLGADHGLSRDQLLQLPAEGLLEAPDDEQVLAAIHDLRQGGRTLLLQPRPGSGDATNQRSSATAAEPPRPGVGQALLLSGLEQISVALSGCDLLLGRRGLHPLARLMLEGRRRELRCARGLLLWLWGPVSLAWSTPLAGPAAAWGGPGRGSSNGTSAAERSGAITLTLRQRSADGIWELVRGRLSTAISGGLSNRSGQLLALEGLNGDRRSDLLLALLLQLDALRQQLAGELAAGDGSTTGTADGNSSRELLPRLEQLWQQLQPQLRQQALRTMASPYVQLPLEGALQPVAQALVSGSDLAVNDPELPEARAMLSALVLAQPLLVEGQLLPADDPRALLHLERLVANWLLRSAELLAADVLACCGGWPELRRYLLRPDLLATRNLEQLRNRLNAQQRWLNWVERPIALYESRRQLLCLEQGSIQCVQLLEPRDRELRQLGPLQQLVTLALETRDALAPQLHSLLRSAGRVVVLLLTEVVGRAIGLVGRGIMQGMGRSLHRP